MPDQRRLAPPANELIPGAKSGLLPTRCGSGLDGWVKVMSGYLRAARSSRLGPTIMTGALLFLIVTPATAHDLVGRYVAAEGPDVAGRMELTREGRFLYVLSAGALDEQAQGHWVQRGDQACLTTAPTPKAPEFQPIPPKSEQSATVMVETRAGRGIPGVDLRIGFASGEPLTGYTQEYGWTLPEDEKRVPRWVELAEPIHRFASPRFDIAADAKGRFRAVLIPNDIGTVNFQGACLEAKDGGYVLHRAEGDMKFRRVAR